MRTGGGCGALPQETLSFQQSAALGLPEPLPMSL